MDDSKIRVGDELRGISRSRAAVVKLNTPMTFNPRPAIRYSLPKDLT